jgi:hypothetical protein
MEKRKATFEDHMTMVSQGHQKTAAANGGKVSGNLLDKLAAELNLEAAKDSAAAKGEAATEAAQKDAPKSEGQKTPADSSVSGANEAVVAATDAVALPQVTAQGGNVAQVIAGEIPAASKPAEVEISDAAGTNIDQNSFGKTPEAVAAAARGAGGAGETGALSSAAASVDTAKEAEFIGAKIAESFQKTLAKTASDSEFSECLAFVKEAGLLEGYQIKVPAGIEKTAEVKTGFLDKIASRQPLSREDIIGAAYEYQAFEKAAADADAEGREEAHALVELLTKVAEESEEKKDDEEEKTETEKKKEEEEEEGEEEKVSSLLKNPKVVEAIRTLKGFDLL